MTLATIALGIFAFISLSICIGAIKHIRSKKSFSSEDLDTSFQDLRDFRSSLMTTHETNINSGKRHTLRSFFATIILCIAIYYGYPHCGWHLLGYLPLVKIDENASSAQLSKSAAMYLLLITTGVIVSLLFRQVVLMQMHHFREKRKYKREEMMKIAGMESAKSETSNKALTDVLKQMESISSRQTEMFGVAMDKIVESSVNQQQQMQQLALQQHSMQQPHDQITSRASTSSTSSLISSLSLTHPHHQKSALSLDTLHSASSSPMSTTVSNNNSSTLPRLNTISSQATMIDFSHGQEPQQQQQQSMVEQKPNAPLHQINFNEVDKNMDKVRGLISSLEI
eukprot:TRINITY_DN1329_c0_g1_i1.p1 TRINITY_DN1329_c0_g1~~TRINITY_DN1329_c0_g1_i1.p1  ORF type:complete len:339 (+),score=71.84 TRINITY_DN1329_c0_g1_i1:105-1121(+)